jgi:hypothetical protein
VPCKSINLGLPRPLDIDFPASNERLILIFNINKALLPCSITIFGYSLLSFLLAFSVVNCHGALDAEHKLVLQVLNGKRTKRNTKLLVRLTAKRL